MERKPDTDKPLPAEPKTDISDEDGGVGGEAAGGKQSFKDKVKEKLHMHGSKH